MSRLILHRAIASPPARSVMMLADILGLDMEIKDINLYKKEHMTPEFKKLNPMQTVPVLQDGDYTLCESHVILKYLLEKYGGEHRERLYPSDLHTRSVVDQCMFFNAGMFFVSVRKLASLTFMGQISGLKPEHQAEIERLYGVVEDYLSNRKYIATDRLTLADLSAGSTATAMQALHRTDPESPPEPMKHNFEQTESVEMSNLLLYKLNASPPACAVRALGDMIGLTFDYKEPDIFNLEHKSAEYMKMNPMGTLPVLKDDDFVLSESHAIMKYLLEKYGGEHRERLYPSDVRTRALVDQCMYFNVGVFFIRLKVVVLPTILEGLKEASPRQLQDIDTAFGVVEAYLENNKYIACDHLTLADLAVGSTAATIQCVHKLDAKRFPRTAKWLDLLYEEPAFKKYVEPATEQLIHIMQTMQEKNRAL